MSDVSEDLFLNGAIRVRQTMGGFRSGLDAVMLAAAVPARAGQAILELGAGTGVASLCLGARVPDCSITAVEIDRNLTELANANAAGNGMAQRLCVLEGDVLSLPAALKHAFDHVFSNPPFHDARGEAAPDEARNRALRDTGRFADWLKAGLKRTVSGGTFTAIFRGDRLAEALGALPGHGIAIFPLWPRADEAAKRVIVQIRNGSNAPLALLPGLVLHEADGRYTAAADAILRDGASLALGKARL